MARKILLLALIAILSISLVACKTETKTTSSSGSDRSESSDSADDSGGESEPEPEPEVEPESEFDGTGSTLADEDAVLEAIMANLDAYQNEDIDGVAATTDESVRDETVASAEWTFETYDLAYELENVVVTMLSDTEAQVSLTQTTTKITGPDFADNRLDAIHSLRKVDGAWVIYASEMVNVEYLD